mgnify:CR=1 FL=1
MVYHNCSFCLKPMVRTDYHGGEAMLFVRGMSLTAGTIKVRCSRCQSDWQEVPPVAIRRAMITLFEASEFSVGTTVCSVAVSYTVFDKSG